MSAHAGSPSATWTLLTPARAAGAIAIIQIQGDVDSAFAACGMKSVGAGHVALRDLLGVDTGLVARFDNHTVHFMPHGGLAVVRALESALTRAGIARNAKPDPRALFPEARSDIDARALHTLTSAASPLAVDLLLAQHARWKAAAPQDGEMDRVLNRLVDPPLVVALGRPNIGKSALVNALARRSVSIVADEQGTTRDHVGVRLNLAGLVVHYVDTPGIRDDADVQSPSADIESRAQQLAQGVARTADLLLVCGDGSHPLPDLDPFLAHLPRLIIALRSDLGAPQTWRADATTCAKSGDGLSHLAALIRETLVPKAALEWQGAWRFWGDAP